MYVSKFRPDMAYGVEDINEITKIVTGRGVVPHTPNDVLKSLSEGGVTHSDEQCAVTYDSTKGTVRIGSGTVIMPNGSYIVVSSGETLSVPTEAVERYVYIRDDELLQNVPTCSAEKPSDTDVPLAVISSEGVLYDRRIYAKSKVEEFGRTAPKIIYYTSDDIYAFEEGPSPSEQRYFPVLNDPTYSYLLISAWNTGLSGTIYTGAPQLFKLGNPIEHHPFLEGTNVIRDGSPARQRAYMEDGRIVIEGRNSAYLDYPLVAIYF